MTLPEAIQILLVHQAWRLGADIEMAEPKVITEAINTVLAYHLANTSSRAEKKPKTETLTGILKETPAGWFVYYQVMRDEITAGYESIPLYQEVFEPTAGQPIIPLVHGKQVEFKIVIEDATHLKVAKLMDQETVCEYSGLPSLASYVPADYPEFEATVSMCEDIVQKNNNRIQLTAKQIYQDAYDRWCLELSHEKNVGIAKNICEYMCKLLIANAASKKNGLFWSEVLETINATRHSELYNNLNS